MLTVLMLCNIPGIYFPLTSTVCPKKQVFAAIYRTASLLAYNRKNCYEDRRSYFNRCRNSYAGF
jgi:hypothetical protein